MTHSRLIRYRGYSTAELDAMIDFYEQQRTGPPGQEANRAGFRKEAGEEYAGERDFRFADVFENGTLLARTEYGSLLGEEMLKTEVLKQFEKACRKLGRGQHLRIRMEVLNAE